MRKLEEHFCTSPQALKLKELGFDEPCFGWFTVEGDGAKSMFIPEKINKQGNGYVLAPIRSQALDFFRDKGYTHITPCTTMGNYWFRLVKNYFVYRTEQFNTYPEAESALIDKLIEIYETDRHI